jgi:hypothetical protein
LQFAAALEFLQAAAAPTSTFSAFSGLFLFFCILVGLVGFEAKTCGTVLSKYFKRQHLKAPKTNSNPVEIWLLGIRHTNGS